MLATSSPAVAKTCKATVKGKNISDTQSQATDAAIAAWSRNAKRKYGASFASWSNAENGRVNCSVTMAQKRQRQQCIAVGKPCGN